MRRLHTHMQLKYKCCIINQQEQEFESWFNQQKFDNVLNLSEYGQWDTVGRSQRIWDKYTKGKFPWDLIMYCNNTEIVELEALCEKIDNLVDQLSTYGKIYMALNKWCIKVNSPDPALIALDFDNALPLYIQNRIKNFTIVDYRFVANDRGGIGNWIHGNNRFWLEKNAQN